MKRRKAITLITFIILNSIAVGLFVGVIIQTPNSNNFWLYVGVVTNAVAVVVHVINLFKQ